MSTGGICAGQSPGCRVSRAALSGKSDERHRASGDTLDALCYRVYGRTAGVVEAVLLVNPGLAERGVILPHGTVVTLPVIDTAPASETVQLWD